MLRHLNISLIALCALLSQNVLYAGSFSCLDTRIPKENARYRTFQTVLELLSQRHVRTIVETGTSRYGDWNCGSATTTGDGCSTLIFGEWAGQNGAILYSVDIDRGALDQAQRGLNNGSITGVQLMHHDSVDYLKNFNQPIDFLYLDSFDYAEWDPAPSQQHHLKEIIAAYPWLTKDSVIMIDDCDLPGGGKGKLVIQYLLEKGWMIVVNSYQVILVLN